MVGRKVVPLGLRIGRKYTALTTNLLITHSDSDNDKLQCEQQAPLAACHRRDLAPTTTRQSRLSITAIICLDRRPKEPSPATIAAYHGRCHALVVRHGRRPPVGTLDSARQGPALAAATTRLGRPSVRAIVHHGHGLPEPTPATASVSHDRHPVACRRATPRRRNGAPARLEAYPRHRDPRPTAFASGDQIRPRRPSTRRSPTAAGGPTSARRPLLPALRPYPRR